MGLQHIEGEESLFYIKKNDVWVPVGCLTSSPLSEDSEMIDTTTRDNRGWKSSYPTNQSYSIELSGMVVKDDIDSGNNIISYRELRSYKRNRTLIDWQRKTLGGYYIDEGKAYIASISDNDPADGFISFNASLTGFGTPLESSDKVYLLANEDEEVIIDEEDTVINTE